MRQDYKDIEVKWQLPPSEYGKDWNDVLKKYGEAHNKYLLLRGFLLFG